jgi:hydroxysqualene dehydroxylase
MDRCGHVIVVGGGIAGIAASVALSRRGVRVTLLEARRRLGGRASSFVDAATGDLLDNGQHVTMGCCTAYLRLLDILGVTHTVRWFEEQHWIEPGGRRSLIHPSPLLAWVPGPAAHAPALMRAKFLSAGEKWSVACAMSQLLMVDRRDSASITFSDWLQSQRQPSRAIRRFWNPIVVSACNLPVTEVSASSAMHVFQDGIAGGVEAARIGVSTVPLATLYDNVARILAESGGELLLGLAATRICGQSVETTRGEFRAEAVVCALPFEKALQVIDVRDWEQDPRLEAMQRATHSAIVCVHVELDRGRVDVPHAVLLDTTCQWVFRKDESGKRLSIVISAAGELASRDDRALASVIEADLRTCFPNEDPSQEIRVGRCRAVRERFATFAATPAFEPRRPSLLGPRGARGPVLAGDYVQTGWPATMEGAAQSGFAAAACLIGF